MVRDVKDAPVRGGRQQFLAAGLYPQIKRTEDAPAELRSFQPGIFFKKPVELFLTYCTLEPTDKWPGYEPRQSGNC